MEMGKEDYRRYKMGDDQEVSFEQVEFEIFIGHQVEITS